MSERNSKKVERHTPLLVKRANEGKLAIGNIKKSDAAVFTSNSQNSVGVVGGHAPDSSSVRVNRALLETMKAAR